ncbi:hypothetical protein BV25DRAFT_1989461 [Artomyces pyxidatus]|uniref:Uncharacterized protein n=1 Tax=Artomyces pyxidatus TaxID=48021 RepID=A0ACB8T9M4_9AGAM|nr:hypothetical protein BV25DRAFT_1989461 [Artomyces pyxidatus]
MVESRLEMSPTSKWQSIRPWSPRLSLSVREITSVSATFVVTSLSSPANLSLLLEREVSDADDDSSSQATSSTLVNTNALSKGLSVKVNGTPWQRVLARIDDGADEAVLIIYGLMPGRQYDVEIGVISTDARVQGQLLTEGITTSPDRDQSRSDTLNIQDVPEVNIFSSSSQTLAIDPPSPPSPSPPATPNSPTHSHQTLEEYLTSLKQTLIHLQAENETLSTSLKSARRDSQKSQAALRSEISSLKRASQKHSAGDARMKQKVRALEEAVKQAVKGREDVEAQYENVEAERIEQENELIEGEKRRDEVKRLAEEGQRRRESAEEEAESKVQGARAELVAVETKLEKLRARREKLDGRTTSEDEREQAVTWREEVDNDGILGGVVGELEAKLREMRMERERIEADPVGYSTATTSHDGEDSAGDGSAHEHSDLPPRFQANNAHHRNHHHHHHHSFIPHVPRGKRHSQGFTPQHSAHSHSHSHPNTHGPHPRNSAALTPSNSAPARPPVSTSRAHHASGRSVHTQFGAMNGGKAPMVRRRSSPPPPIEKSTLSSLAPPFEPASVRGKSGAAWTTGS